MLTEQKIKKPLAQRQKFIQAISNLADSRIGTDPSGNSPPSLMSEAYAGLLMHDKKSGVLIDSLVEAGRQRHNTEYPMRSIHGALIFIYAINHLMMFRYGYPSYADYFQLHEPQNWTNVYSLIENDPHALSSLFDILKEKDLMTSNPRRANDLNFIIKRTLGRQIETWTDLGSSMGFPVLATLMGDADDELMSFRDNTKPGQDEGYLKATCANPIKAQKTILVDHTNPYRDINWFLSCTYPGDTTQEKVDRVRSRIQKYRSTSRVKFEERNMIDLPSVQHRSEVVTAIMSVYELERETQREFVEEIMPAHITPGGVMVVKDYVEVDGENLIFTDDRSPYTCKTAIRGPQIGDKWLLVTQHSTSRCHTTEKGPDFDEFIELVSHLTHNQKTAKVAT